MKESLYKYEKKPLWQWVVVYFLISLVLYGLVFSFVWARSTGFRYEIPFTQNIQN